MIAHKGRAFTVRLTSSTEDWIDREARRGKRPKSAVLEELLDGAIRVRRFPRIAFRGPAHGRRAWLVGTSLDVWEIIEALQAMGEARLLAESDLSADQVHLAIGYYRAYPDEIDEAVAENRRTEAEWHALYPSVMPAPEWGYSLTGRSQAGASTRVFAIEDTTYAPSTKSTRLKVLAIRTCWTLRRRMAVGSWSGRASGGTTRACSSSRAASATTSSG